MTVVTRLRWVIWLALTVAVCASCSRDAPYSSFVRTYETDHANGTETLTLETDGTYRHYFKNNNGGEARSSGKWELVKIGRKQRILVHSFTPYFPGRPQVATDWLLEPYQHFGYVRLYVSREPRQFYLELPENASP
jgi:hypothetical protein